MIVYLLTNQVNGKVYIGQHTSFRLEKRWNKTLSGRNKANRHLASAISKYGAHNFTRTILCYASCQEELNLLERFFIAAYQSHNRQFGYNVRLGGQPPCVFTKEVRNVLSEASRQAWKRGVYRNHSEAHKRWWRNLSAAERRLQSLKQSLTSPKPMKGRPPWNKGKRGIPSGKKGKRYGPQKNPCRNFPPPTKQHKEKLSQALKRYHRERRKKERKRPKKG
jgi:group I intron endonuclease